MSSYTLGKRDRGYFDGSASNGSNGIVNGVFYSGATGVAPPTIGTLGGPGDRVVYQTATSSTSYPTSVGVNTNELWQSIATGGRFTWYVNGVAVATLLPTGFTLLGSVSGTSATFSGAVTSIAATGAPSAATLGAANGKAFVLAGTSAVAGAIPIALMSMDGTVTYGTFSSTGLVMTGSTSIQAPTGAFTGQVTAGSFSGPLTGNSTGTHSGPVVGGAISGTTGTFTGTVSSTGFTGPLTGNSTGTHTGAVVGGTVTGTSFISTPADPSTNVVILNFKNFSGYGISALSSSVAGRGSTLDFQALDFNSGGAITTRSLLSLRPEGTVTVSGPTTFSNAITGTSGTFSGALTFVGATNTGTYLSPADTPSPATGSVWSDPSTWTTHINLRTLTKTGTADFGNMRIGSLPFQSPGTVGIGSAVIQHVNNFQGSGPVYIQPAGGSTVIGAAGASNPFTVNGPATFTGQISGTSAVFSGTVTASSITGTVASGGSIPNGNDATTTAGLYFTNNNTIAAPVAISVASNNFGASKRAAINFGTWKVWQDSANTGIMDLSFMASGTTRALQIAATGDYTTVNGQMGVFNPTLGTGAFNAIAVGAGASNNNAAYWAYYNQNGLNSPLNYMQWNLFGSSNLMKYDGNGVLTAPSAVFATSCQSVLLNSTAGIITSQGGTVNRVWTYGSSSGNGCSMSSIGSGGAGTHVTSAATGDSVLTAYGGGRLFIQTAASAFANNANPAIVVGTNNQVTFSSSQSVQAPGGLTTAGITSTTLNASGSAQASQVILPGAYNTNSQAINLCNNGQAVTWGNTTVFSQIVDDGNLHLCTDDTMNFHLNGVGGQAALPSDPTVLQLTGNAINLNKQANFNAAATFNAAVNYTAPQTISLGAANNQAGLTVIGGGVISNPHTFSPTYSKDGFVTPLNSSNGLRDGQNVQYQRAKAFFIVDIDTAFGGSPTSVAVQITHNRNMNPVTGIVCPDIQFSDNLGQSTGSPLTWSGRITNILANTCELVITCLGGSAGQSLQAVTGKGGRVHCTLTFFV